MMNCRKPLTFFVFFFLSVDITRSPLLAMDREEELRPQPRSFRMVLYKSTQKALIGAGFLYTGTQPEFEDKSPTGHGMYWAREVSSVCGVHLIASALYDPMAWLYENWRHDSINSKIKKLRENPSQIKHIGKNTTQVKEQKKQYIKNRIDFLSNVNPREEFIYGIKCLKYGIDLFETSFVCWRTLNILYESNTTYSLLPRYTYVFNDNNIGECLYANISVIGTAACLANALWSLYYLRELWKGERLGQDVPLKGFLRTLSNLTSSRLSENLALQYFESLPAKALHAGRLAVKKGLVKADTEALTQYMLDYVANDQLRVGKFLEICEYVKFFQFGNGIFHFFEGCKKLYDERNYWFGLVDELAEVKPTAHSPLESQISPQSSITPKEKQFIADPSKDFAPEEKTILRETLEDRLQKGIVSDPSPVSKQPKKKTKGTSNKHLPNDSSSQQPSVTIESLKLIDKKDQERREALEKIQHMRSSNSVPKREVQSMAGQAAIFMNGTVKKDKNKIAIDWKRGQISRSVKFESTHKQRNEKASIFKGHKLKMALDALEQVYLDGWDRENILSHLNGRFKLYYLPYECLKVLWISQEDEER